MITRPIRLNEPFFQWLKAYQKQTMVETGIESSFSTLLENRVKLSEELQVQLGNAKKSLALRYARIWQLEEMIATLNSREANRLHNAEIQNLDTHKRKISVPKKVWDSRPIKGAGNSTGRVHSKLEDILGTDEREGEIEGF